MNKRTKWSLRDERRVEDNRRQEITDMGAALAAAHSDDDVGAYVARVIEELRGAWRAADVAEQRAEGARHERGSMQQRLIVAQRQTRETQAQLDALRAQTSPERVTALEAEVRALRAQLAEARAETLRARQGRPQAAPSFQAQPMPAQAAWVLIRQQAALRSTVAMMRPELLAREDAAEVLCRCTLLTVAADGTARVAALEDLRAALVLLRSKAARDSLGPKDASAQDASTPGASFRVNSFQVAS